MRPGITRNTNVALLVPSASHSLVLIGRSSSVLRPVALTTNGSAGTRQLRADFGDAPPQEAALGLGVRELEGALVLGPCFVGPAHAAQ